MMVITKNVYYLGATYFAWPSTKVIPGLFVLAVSWLSCAPPALSPSSRDTDSSDKEFSEWALGDEWSMSDSPLRRRSKNSSSRILISLQGFLVSLFCGFGKIACGLVVFALVLGTISGAFTLPEDNMEPFPAPDIFENGILSACEYKFESSVMFPLCFSASVFPEQPGMVVVQFSPGPSWWTMSLAASSRLIDPLSFESCTGQPSPAGTASSWFSLTALLDWTRFGWFSNTSSACFETVGTGLGPVPASRSVLSLLSCWLSFTLMSNSPLVTGSCRSPVALDVFASVAACVMCTFTVSGLVYESSHSPSAGFLILMSSLVRAQQELMASVWVVMSLQSFFFSCSSL